MSEGTRQFREKVCELIDTIGSKEQESVDRAADLMVQAITDDELIHVIGTGGHSNMGAWEMFSRAGGLAAVNAILDPGTSLQYGARRSSAIERTPGYGVAVLKAYDITDGVMIIVNAYGINAMTIDTALEAKSRGLPTIGITSREFSERIPADHPARHPTGKNLCDIVDVHVDCHMPYGDSVVKLEGLEATVAPVSTIVNSFVAQLLVTRTAEKLLEKGIKPPIWISGNVPGGDEANLKLRKRYPPERFAFG
jgi:uncharacterized phosphosugar-binding protein